MPKASVQLHDRHWLDGVGGIQHVDDFVQALLGTRDTSDAFPLRRCELKVSSADACVVSFFIQGRHRNEGAANGRRMQRSVQGELQLGATIRHPDDKCPASNGRETLLVRRVQEDQGYQR